MKYDPEPDLLVRAVPCPNDIDDDPHSMLVLRVRSKPWIASAAAHVSVDGQSYLQIADSLPHVVGAQLLEPMPFAATEHEVGPLVKILGPDANQLRVLGDGDWRIGRQVMLVETEWCFVREIEAVAGDMYRIHGLLRGRYGSTAREHPAGADGFLSDIRHLTPIQDASVRLGRDLWIKTQPYSGRPLPLTACTATRCTMNKPAPRWMGRGETPLGRIDGVNAAFLLGTAPEPGTLMLFRDGRLLRPGSRGDFFLDGFEITLHEAPPGGSWLLCWYEPLEG